MHLDKLGMYVHSKDQNKLQRKKINMDFWMTL